MFEASIINFLGLDERIGKLELYKKPKALFFFKLFKALIEAKINSFTFILFFKLIFFMQIFLCSMETIRGKDENQNSIMNYLERVFLFSDLIKTSDSFTLSVTIHMSFCVILFIWILLIIVSGCIKNVQFSFILIGLNIVNDLLRDYLLFPYVKIGLLTFYCDSNKKHYFADIQCYSGAHLGLITYSIFSILFILTYIILLTMFNNQIGSLKKSTVYFRINSHYEIYEITSKLIMIAISFYSSYYSTFLFSGRVITIAIITLVCLGMCFYIYKKVFFYYELKNILIFYGWVFSTWSSFVMLLKLLFEIHSVIFFLGSGWIILTIFCYYLETNRIESLLINNNIFESQSIKEIELFINKLNKLSNDKRTNSKTLLKGIIFQFTNNIIFLNEDFKEKYQNIYDNEILFKTGNCPKESMSAIAIIYILYNHYLKSSQFLFDIFILFSHFIVRKLHNPSLVLYFCAKIKEESFKHFFLKYLLVEEIKEIYIKKLLNQEGSDSIRHIQLSSVILYNLYIDTLKLKIYDAICNQIDYFDMIKNDSVIKNRNLCSDFIKKSEEIIKAKKDITSLYRKIINLNPFSPEVSSDYLMYLDTIIKDEQLSKKEKKTLSTIKMQKYPEKDNIYYLLFDKELSSILLVDGNDMKGRVIYTTPNFESMYHFNPNEVINMPLELLLPNAIVSFHSIIMSEAIKYSNIRKIFAKQRDTYIKGKHGYICQVKMFLKPIPNLTYGLIYIVSFIKNLNNSINRTILLDHNLTITDTTPSLQKSTIEKIHDNRIISTMSGNHIAMVMPEILLQIEYVNNAFTIYQNEIDLKGYIFQPMNQSVFKDNVVPILDKLKQGEKISVHELYIDKSQNEATVKYKQLFNMLLSSHKPNSIFYSIEKRQYVNRKYFYYIISITNPLNEMNELYSLGFTSPQLTNNKKAKQDTINTLSLSQKRKRNGFMTLKKINSISPTGAPNRTDQDFNSGSRLLGNTNSESNNKALQSKLTISFNLKTKFRVIQEIILSKTQGKTNSILRYLTYIFGICTFVLMFGQLILVSHAYSRVLNFFEQNMFFNHTKVFMSVLLSSVANANYIKNKYKLESSCHPFNCTDFVSNEINRSTDRVSTIKANTRLTFKDIRNINKILVKIQYYVDDFDHLTYYNIDLDNLIGLVLVNSLFFNDHLSQYTSQLDSGIENTFDNLLYLTNLFASTEAIKGFNNEEKTNRSKQFLSSYYLILINVAILVFLVSVYSYFIWKTFTLEKSYSEKFLHFNPPSFVLYLKYLETLKQKLKEQIVDDDINEEKEEMNEEEHSLNEENNKGGPKEKKSSVVAIQERKPGSNNKSKKKKIAKQKKKIIEKRKILINYFIENNLMFFFKLFIILIITLSYYFTTIFVEKKCSNGIISIDNNINYLFSCYKEEYDVFLIIKNQFTQYANFLRRKEQGLSLFLNGTIANIFINGINYSTRDQLQEASYEMILPNKSQLNLPSFDLKIQELINQITYKTPQMKLTTLYSGNACNVLFNVTDPPYELCINSFSTLFQKGLSQVLIFVERLFDNTLYELSIISSSNINNIFSNSSSFSNMELFFEVFAVRAYEVMIEIKQNIKQAQYNYVTKMFHWIFAVYGIIFSMFIFYLVIHMELKKNIILSFLNFICIVPFEYLNEDEKFISDILLLKKELE